MKKFLMALGIVTILFSSSCTRFDDEADIVDTLDNYLFVSQLNMAGFAGGYNSVYSCMITQQIAGVSGKMLEIDQYDIDMYTTNSMWSYYYINLMNNLKKLIVEAEKGNFSKYSGIGKVLLANSIGMGTDIWGDIPVQSFIDGTFVPYPQFDSQEDIYTRIFEILDDAISDLELSAGQNYPGEFDVYFSGNTGKWIKFANYLKLKYSLRVSSVLGWDHLYDLTQESLFTSFSDTLLIDYELMQYPYSPFYTFSNAYPNQIKAGEKLVNLMLAVSDPRLPVYFQLNTLGFYSGSSPGIGNITASKIGEKYSSSYSNYLIASYTEQMFIMAEVYFRNGMFPESIDAYNEGLRSSLLFNKVYNEEWFNLNKLESDITIEHIINAKYIALFLNHEVWVDWRRTGFPTLTPAANNLTGDNIPRRLPYPSEEYSLNPDNVPVNVPIYQPFWWDSLGF